MNASIILIIIGVLLIATFVAFKVMEKKKANDSYDKQPSDKPSERNSFKI